MLPDPETKSENARARGTYNEKSFRDDLRLAYRYSTGTLPFSVLYRYVPVLTRTHNLKPTPRVQSIVLLGILYLIFRYAPPAGARYGRGRGSATQGARARRLRRGRGDGQIVP